MEKCLKYWVWLSSVPTIGPVKFKKLIEHFKTPLNVWKAGLSELGTLKFLSRINIEQLLTKTYREEADKNYEDAVKSGIDIVTIEDKEYPEYLNAIYDPPMVIYKRGNLKTNEKCIGIVGSRKPTTYGLSISKTIARELSNRGITVVSGLARGIDSYAHTGVVEGNGRTIAVLGSGLNNIYPRENTGLAEKITQNGVLISEYIPKTPPLPSNFPARNRIISGMSHGILVIEAGQKSGSLITADFALEQGREVFAIPGNLNSSKSMGTNKLIKEGAKLVTSIQDILEEIKCFDCTGKDNVVNKMKESGESKKNEILFGLESDEKRVVEILMEESLHIDSIANMLGFSVHFTSSVLTMLELKGIIEQYPGKIFKLRQQRM